MQQHSVTVLKSNFLIFKVLTLIIKDSFSSWKSRVYSKWVFLHLWGGESILFTFFLNINIYTLSKFAFGLLLCMYVCTSKPVKAAHHSDISMRAIHWKYSNLENKRIPFTSYNLVMILWCLCHFNYPDFRYNFEILIKTMYFFLNRSIGIVMDCYYIENTKSLQIISYFYKLFIEKSIYCLIKWFTKWRSDS